MAKKKILLNAFNMNCIGHINHGLWTHPRDTSTQYKTLEYWTEHGLDRHWRNARTHTLHDPVRWKRHAVGNYYLNDAAPGRVGTT